MDASFFKGIKVDLGNAVEAGFSLSPAPDYSVFPRLKQVHGVQGFKVEPGFFEKEIPEGDWLWTDVKNCRIAVVVADCTAVLVAGSKNKKPFVAAIHAGWRGTAKGILKEAVLELKPDPGWRAWLSPSIAQDHFEVGEDVLREFAPDSLRLSKPSKRPGKFLFDLKQFQMDQLKQLGGSLSFSNLCTYCEPNLFSFRQSQNESGHDEKARHLVWIEIL
jgi:YfiH family protein